MRHALWLLILLSGACNNNSPAPAAADLALQRVFPQLSFENPLFLTAAPGDTQRLFVAAQPGRVHVFNNAPDPAAAPVFLDITAKVRSGGEEGLLGLAFHPDYAQNGFFYVYYTAAADPRRSVISRFKVSSDPAVADAGSETILLEIPQPFANHNGGMLAFGPDGMLYIASGDGGSGGDPQNNGQSLMTLLGKILRLTPDGGVPADNPFAAAAAPGTRGEIWAYGLRNPWRFSFDRGNGELWAGDVGQNKYEEVDLIVKGGNYGWRLYEGNEPFNNPDNRPASDFVAPVITYDHDQGCSITGGYVYRGSALPALAGQYLYADFCSGRVWALSQIGPRYTTNRQIGTVPNPSSFGEDAAGELYLTSFDGGIYKLAPGQ